MTSLCQLKSMHNRDSLHGGDVKRFAFSEVTLAFTPGSLHHLVGLFLC